MQSIRLFFIIYYWFSEEFCTFAPQNMPLELREYCNVLNSIQI